ncbi:MAG: barstar family protein [Burkholderiales bacterium]
MDNMDALAKLLADVAKCGVYQLNQDVRQLAQAANDAGLKVWRVDIGHAHDKKDFLASLAKALDFPQTFGGNWDALADCLRDLSWVEGKGYVVILEKSKHFHAAHQEEFDIAIDILAEAAEYWKSEGRPFWGLIGGPEGWISGCREMPGT